MLSSASMDLAANLFQSTVLVTASPPGAMLEALRSEGVREPRRGTACSQPRRFPAVRRLACNKSPFLPHHRSAPGLISAQVRETLGSTAAFFGLGATAEAFLRSEGFSTAVDRLQTIATDGTAQRAAEMIRQASSSGALRNGVQMAAMMSGDASMMQASCCCAPSVAWLPVARVCRGLPSLYPHFLMAACCPRSIPIFRGCGLPSLYPHFPWLRAALALSPFSVAACCPRSIPIF